MEYGTDFQKYKMFTSTSSVDLNIFYIMRVPE